MMALAAANTMSKIEEEKSMIRCLWLEAAPVMGDIFELPPEASTTENDKLQYKGSLECMECHCYDKKKQMEELDPIVFPGRVPVEEMALLPPTFCLTAE